MLESADRYSFWAVVNPEGSYLISVAKYFKKTADNINECVWFIKIDAAEPYIIFFPYITNINLNLEIRSNNSLPIPITEEILETATMHYPGAKPLPMSEFESGPIMGLFHRTDVKQVEKCHNIVSSGIMPLKNKAEWAVETKKTLRWLTTTLPYAFKLPTPLEVLGLEQ